MLLRNKKTGEIKEFTLFDGNELQGGATLESLTKEWEDHEEPKTFWFIDEEGIIRNTTDENWPEESVVAARSIGNYFETKEEAQKAVERLKIYNKLKQKGFVFSGWYYSTEGQLVILADNHEFSETEPEDLTELFGDKIC